MNVKCNECGYIGHEDEFPHGRDFFQNPYISSCPKCDNRQNPGDASMRAFGGKRPFEFVRETIETDDPLESTLIRASGAA